MSDKKKNEGVVYFIDVPKAGRPVANNTLIVKSLPILRDSAGNITRGESTVFVGSDGQGLYTIQKTDREHDAKVAALKAKMVRENTGKYPVLLGPFSDSIEAFKAMHEAREKTSDESVALLATENDGLKTALADKDAELEELRAKIAASQKK